MTTSPGSALGADAVIPRDEPDFDAAVRAGVHSVEHCSWVGEGGWASDYQVDVVNAMLEHGIRVYIYPGMSHVKAAIFDDWACIGSANWDRWSLRINKELNIATSDPDAVRELREQLFEADFAKSVELREPFPERWSDYLIEMIGDYVF